MRAREPDHEGVIERAGVRVGYDVYGAGEPTILLLTSWAIVHARQWKAQVPWLARRFRVITVEGRGNGRADRPGTAEAYSDQEYVEDVIAVLDAAGADQAVVVGLSMGGRHALQLAAWYPERAAGVIAIGAALPWPVPPDFDEPKDGYEGWGKANRHYWLADYRGWVEFFMSQVFTEPHSIKQQEDAVGWGLETTAETLLLTAPAVAAPTAEDAEAICRQVRCPVLVVHGDQDGIVPYETGVALAHWTGGQLVTIHGGGHAPTLRDPVQVNLLIRGFAESLRPRTAGRRSWTRGRDRRKRALYVSSPIGLGHVRRDLAIADELRARHPDLEIDWLTQHPVTQVLQERGERVHPASRWLASESAHIESEAGEHDLNVFQAARRMDEIMVANFMVFHDLVSRRAVRPVDRRRGLGCRPFPVRQPGAQADRLRLAHRLRGLAADARGRRGRGRPDRGLERGAGRADAALPAAAGPVDLRRQSRRPGGRLRSGRNCRPCATGRWSGTRAPGTSPGRLSRTIGRRCAPN